MADARMNAVNDSGPLHLCSAMDAPVMAIFCSTVPGFGFGPLSTNSEVVETKKDLQWQALWVTRTRAMSPWDISSVAHTLDVKTGNHPFADTLSTFQLYSAAGQVPTQKGTAASSAVLYTKRTTCPA